jgi:hypothetical protein
VPNTQGPIDRKRGGGGSKPDNSFIGKDEATIRSSFEDKAIAVVSKIETTLNFACDLWAEKKQRISAPSQIHRFLKTAGHHFVQELEKAHEVALATAIRTNQHVQRLQLKVLQ